VEKTRKNRWGFFVAFWLNQGLNQHLFLILGLIWLQPKQQLRKRFNGQLNHYPERGNHSAETISFCRLFLAYPGFWHLDSVKH
jgi:hypothetical protein